MRANCQKSQYKYIIQNLALRHAIYYLHDYLEHYRRCEQNRGLIQVTILSRYAILELDGLDITLNSPVIVSEQLFFISPNFILWLFKINFYLHHSHARIYRWL